MKKKTLGAVLTLLTLATPGLAQSVDIDYAHDYDFDAVETFAYVATPDSSTGNQLIDDRIRGAIVRQLQAGGLQQDEASPDLYVTSHVMTQDNQVFNTTTYGYGGWGPGWGAWAGGMGGATTTSTTYTEGTLIVDAYDPQDKKLVWRGTGTVTVKDDPAKRGKQIDSILTKLGKRWQKILAEEGT